MAMKPMRSARLSEAVPLSLVTDWLSAPLPAASAGIMVQGVSTDTRTLQPGDLFIALRGEQFDAHEFLEDVREAGAVAAVVESGHPMLSSPALDGWPLIVCDDTRHALGTLGQAWRQRFSLPVVAVTGSNGKTTTKELVTHLFAAAVGADAVLSTLGNFNNEIGLPLTLLRLSAEHRYAVIELGMSHPGEIAALAQLAQPSIAIVTNAQRAHLAGMGSLVGVAEEKGSLFDALPEGGSAIVNLDDPHADQWLARIQAGREVLGTHVQSAKQCGASAPAFVAEIIETSLQGQVLQMTTPAAQVKVMLPLSGAHNASNTAQAMAAGFAAGLDVQAMAASLANFGGVAGRLQRKQTGSGAQIIDDTYNANPDSMRAAIDVLVAGLASTQTVLVIGDMGEVGVESEALHAEVGAYAAQRGVGVIYAVGALSANAVKAYQTKGAGEARHFATQEELVAALKNNLGVDTVVLVKGSRSSRMENVVNAIVDQA
ncbi:MAG: UDP-N-acetylmuramoyl-tripeptide--D-alanyl-D-alanine ligase [Fluviibacter sp.]